MVWEDAVGSTGVHKETPVEDLVLHVETLPGGPTPPPTPRPYSSSYPSALLLPQPIGPTPPPTFRPYSSSYPFWKGRPALRAVSCYLPELMNLRFPGQFSSLRHSASTPGFSADL
jgi:hypothetical protein